MFDIADEKTWGTSPAKDWIEKTNALIRSFQYGIKVTPRTTIMDYFNIIRNEVITIERFYSLKILFFRGTELEHTNRYNEFIFYLKDNPLCGVKKPSAEIMHEILKGSNYSPDNTICEVIENCKLNLEQICSITY